MFDRLIVSEPDQSEAKKRRGYFMVSSLVVGVLFITGVVISIFAADFSLGTNNFELTELIAPMDLAEKSVEPEPQREQPAATQTSAVPTRQVNMQAISESPRVPTAISTAPNNVMTRPTGEFTIGKVDSNPAAVGGVGRTTGAGPAVSGTGLVAATTEPTEVDTTPPPPVKKDPPKNVIMSKGVVNGIANSLPKPPYPPAAQAIGAQGAVNVQVTISESGDVISARAVSGPALLRSAAEGAARRAKFSPTTLSGEPVKVTGVIIYNFTR